MTIERPMFPPRAGSVHAFPVQPAISPYSPKAKRSPMTLLGPPKACHAERP
jgi:hypothetical protein